MMADDVVSMTAMFPLENADASHGDATIAFSYSRQGLMQAAQATRDRSPFTAALFVTAWDLNDADGSPLPLDADIPIQVFEAIFDAALRDAQRRFPQDTPQWAPDALPGR